MNYKTVVAALRLSFLGGQPWHSENKLDCRSMIHTTTHLISAVLRGPDCNCSAESWRKTIHLVLFVLSRMYLIVNIRTARTL